MLNKILLTIGLAAAITSGTVADEHNSKECKKLINNLDENGKHIDEMGELSEKGEFKPGSPMEEILDQVSEINSLLDNKRLNNDKLCGEWNERVGKTIKAGIDQATITRSPEMKKKYQSFKWTK